MYWLSKQKTTHDIRPRSPFSSLCLSLVFRALDLACFRFLRAFRLGAASLQLLSELVSEIDVGRADSAGFFFMVVALGSCRYIAVVQVISQV